LLSTANEIPASLQPRYHSTEFGSLLTPNQSPERHSEPPFVAHIENLSFDATSQDIQAFFKDCGSKNIKIVVGKLEMKPNCFAYVEFSSHTGLRKALDLNGDVLLGRNIRISVADPKSRHNFDETQNLPELDGKMLSPLSIFRASPTPKLTNSPWLEDLSNQNAPNESITAALTQPALPYLVATL
jgi:RNA recognition motif-containing protein